MLVQLRPNIWLAGQDGLTEENAKKLKEEGVNRIVIVADNGTYKISLFPFATVFVCPLREDRMNPTHIKDLACHCPKYMVQNGDKVLIASKTGMGRGAYIAARMICELEGKSIYDIFLEMQPMIEGFDIGKAYF